MVPFTGTDKARFHLEEGFMKATFVIAGILCTFLGTFVYAVVFAAPGTPSEAQAAWHFDSTTPGDLPDGWRVDGTAQDGPSATWAIIEDPTAPSGGQALALTSPNHHSASTFNLCWAHPDSFYDGTVAVKFKANGGVVDQGGGIMWRVRDHNDYYVCRMNPLENNFRVYVVSDGRRKQLASADVTVETGTWHKIVVRQDGTRITCSLDGKELLAVNDDTIDREGGVGLWTKADAATAFDDFAVTIDAANAPAEKREPKEKTRHGTRYLEGS